MAYKKRILIGTGVFLGIFLLLFAFINTPPGRSVLSSLITHTLGREVTFNGYIYPRLTWPPSLHVSHLTVANMEDGLSENMAEIGVMKIAPAWINLAKGKILIRRLILTDSRLNLERNLEGEANWKFSDEPDDNNDPPSLEGVYLDNSTLTYYDELRETDIRLDVTTQSDRFTLSGEGTHLNKGFKIAGEVGTNCLAQKTECPADVTLTVGETSLHAKGVLAQIMPPEGADFALHIKGADAAELFPLFGIALPPSPPYQLTGQLTYADQRWRFSNFEGTMGESDLSGNLVWDISHERPLLTAKFVSNKLRFEDLGPFIGKAPQTPVSDKQKTRAANQQASDFVIPNVPLDISRLSAMDAEVEFTGKQIISPSLPLDDFYLKVSLDDRLLHLKPIQFGTANGNISANLTVNARQTPFANEADIRFDKLSLARLFGNVGNKIGDIEPAQGYIGGTMQLRGSGKSLHEMMSRADGVAGIGMEGGAVSNLLIKLLSLDIARSLGFLLAGDEPLQVRCLVASFDVKDGIMTTDRFVFDTADTNIKGKGTVNLATEELDLRIDPAPKEATLLSLRSPIHIEGTLKHPDVVIEKGPIAARSGIAVGLGVLAPVAAIIALVDTGKGKDSNCPQLLAHVHEKTGKNEVTDAIPDNTNLSPAR